MKYSTKPGKLSALTTDCLIVPLGTARAIADGTELSRHLDAATRTFDDGIGQTCLVPLPADSSIGHLLIVGTAPDRSSREGPSRDTDVPGNGDAISISDFHKLIRAVGAALKQLPVRDATLVADALPVAGYDLEQRSRVALAQLSAQLYWFDEYQSEKASRTRIGRIHLATDGTPRGLLARVAEQAQAMDAGMTLARDLGNRPANVCNPSHLAREARKFGKAAKTSVKVLDEAAMTQLGMGALMSVSVGSDTPAKLIIVEYKGGAARTAPVVLVGKGITFDTGGISLKPAAAMDEMKFDMCGAAAVLGTMRAVIDARLPINVVALVAAAENMPSGRATRPGDIVTSMSGRTIEVLNTDAEGRMVLCDALTYAERYKPRAVVDVATLTGACIVALGSHASAVFANDDALAQTLIAAGTSIWDRAWHMPLWDDYQSQLKSNFADVANVGGRDAGAITAACFLSRFTRKYPWAHLDIAGSGFNSGANKGATGRPVPLLFKYLLDQCDGKR